MTNKTPSSKSFIQSLTRTSSAPAGISKRKVIASVSELVAKSVDPTVTLTAALMNYSHNNPNKGKGAKESIINSSEFSLDAMRFISVFKGFTSVGEYLGLLPSIAGNKEQHIGMVANFKNMRQSRVYSGDTSVSFKDADSLAKFGNFMRAKFACMVENEIVFGDELNRPAAILTLLQHEPRERPLDPFTFELVCGDESLFEEITSVLNETTSIATSSARLTTIMGVSAGGLDTKEEELDPLTLKLAAPCFYPWMKGVTVEQYFKEFLESDANVLVLYGPPGTGKSSMLITAVARLGLSGLLTSNSAVTNNPEFLSRLGQKLANDEGHYDMVIVEDADSLMTPRDEGNHSLSQLLNSTSGMSQKLRFKLVLTSNKESNEDIDPALLRHGRCYDRMLFGRLDANEALEVSEYLGRPPVKFPANVKEMTLAEVINTDIKSVKSLRNSKVSIVAPRFPLPNRPSKK